LFGYTTRCRKSIDKIGAKELIPPRRNAKKSEVSTRRNHAILEILGLSGDNIAREIWGKLTGYSKRSLVETSFSKIKRLYGSRFYSRKMESQRIEGGLKCEMLNQMMRKTA
jgi:hypothetical protein